MIRCRWCCWWKLSLFSVPTAYTLQVCVKPDLRNRQHFKVLFHQNWKECRWITHQKSFSPTSKGYRNEWSSLEASSTHRTWLSLIIKLLHSTYNTLVIAILFDIDCVAANIKRETEQYIMKGAAYLYASYKLFLSPLTKPRRCALVFCRNPLSREVVRGITMRGYASQKN